MGSGNKRLVMNTRERAVSNDINRLQSFAVADGHEALRARWNQEIHGDFFNTPGLVFPYSAVPAAGDLLVPHDCISGLMVRPDLAGSLLIDPGEAGFFVPAFPNSDADDSDYVIVKDAGVQALGILTFTANGGPGVRWDIVECQPTESLLESSSRDIYDPGTGQFTPATVAKVRGGTLTYRIRLGTPGAGIPDPDPAWLPLAAVHVRTDATGFDNSDVYDLRPLVSEQAPTSMRANEALPSTTIYRSVLDEAQFGANSGAGGGFSLQGYWRGQYGGYYTGGNIKKNVPASNLANFGDTTEASGGMSARWRPDDLRNQSGAGVTTGADNIFAMCALFPKGYARWVRYSQTSISVRGLSGRLPQGARGILVLSTTAAGLQNGLAIATLPAAAGHATACQGQVINAVAYDDSAGDYFPAIGGTHDRKFYFPVGREFADPNFTDYDQLESPIISVGANNVRIAPNPVALWSVDFTVVQPSGMLWARAVLLRVTLTFTTDASAGRIDVRGIWASFSGTAGVPGFRAIPVEFSGCSWESPAGTSATWTGHVWMPFWPQAGGALGSWDSTGGVDTGLTIQGANFPGAFINAIAASAHIVGFQA